MLKENAFQRAKTETENNYEVFATDQMRRDDGLYATMVTRKIRRGYEA